MTIHASHFHHISNSHHLSNLECITFCKRVIPNSNYERKCLWVLGFWGARFGSALWRPCSVSQRCQNVRLVTCRAMLGLLFVWNQCLTLFRFNINQLLKWDGTFLLNSAPTHAVSQKNLVTQLFILFYHPLSADLDQLVTQQYHLNIDDRASVSGAGEAM